MNIAFYSILPIYPNIRRQSLLWLRRVLLLQLVNIRSKSACCVFDKIIYWQTTQPQKKLLLWASGKTVARNCTFIKKKLDAFWRSGFPKLKVFFPASDCPLHFPTFLEFCFRPAGRNDDRVELNIISYTAYTWRLRGRPWVVLVRTNQRVFLYPWKVENEAIGSRPRETLKLSEYALCSQRTVAGRWGNDGRRVYASVNYFRFMYF